MRFVSILKLRKALIKCVCTPGRKVDVLIKVQYDLFEVSFVKVTSNNKESIRIFVYADAKHTMKHRQGQYCCDDD